MLYTLYLRTSPCNKYYVGCTTKTPEYRAGIGGIGYKETRMWEDIERYGWDTFKTEVLCQTDDPDEATRLEDYYMQLYDSRNPEHGYNAIKSGGARSAESIQRQAESMHRNLMDPDSYFQSEERRQKQSKALRESHNRPEVRQKMRDSAKAYWNAETRKQRSDKMKEVMSRPDVRARHKAATSTPEYKAHWKARHDEVCSSPEHRAKMSKSQSGRVSMYREKDDWYEATYVTREQVDKYLQEGWKLGGKPRKYRRDK